MKYIKIGSAFQVFETFAHESIIKGFDIQCDQYTLNIDGLLTIKKYYTWDGPTGAFNTKSFVKGSCIHDVFCDLINAGLLPESVQCQADEEMLKINRRQQMWWPRRAWTYMAVRLHMITKNRRHTPKVYEVL